MNLSPAVMQLVDLAIEEDLGRGDVTSAAIFDGDGGPATGVLLAKDDLVVYGFAVAQAVFARVSPALRLAPRVGDGAFVTKGTLIADVAGPVVPLLAAERPALNFLQRLSGVATASRRFAEAVQGTRARVIDTRKTTPGWRLLEKSAVAAGGCVNHRADLGSGVLIKDNHIAAAGGVGAAVGRARSRAPHGLKIEVEVTNLAELDEALAARADIVLLDNMSLELLAQAIPRAHAGGALIEVSGNVRLETVRAIAELGPDLISSGSITHSARAADISLDLDRAKA
jgi:nicotinate-nucleotide pyrophosphorylase (carboxylating)